MQIFHFEIAWRTQLQELSLDENATGLTYRSNVLNKSTDAIDYEFFRLIVKMLVSSRSIAFRGFPRLISAVLVTAILNPVVSFAECIEKLQGKAYINLPQGVCPHYTDILLSHGSSQQAFSGVICEQSKMSYILLQKRLNYTDQGKAVWQVVQIKQVKKPSSQSFVMAVGCQFKNEISQSREPIFALVQPGNTEEYQTLAAWKVNVEPASFSTLQPQQVICKNPLL